MNQHRIEPIEKPNGIFAKIAYRMIRKQFGKVIMPAKIIYARYPSLFMWVKKMSDIEAKEIPIEPELKLLIKYYIAFLNGCAFCLDIGEKLGKIKNISTDKFHEVANFRNNDSFDDREKAALEFAEQANNQHVDDAIFSELKNHFDEKQIVGLAYIVATENFYNIMNHSLGIESDQLCAIQ